MLLTDKKLTGLWKMWPKNQFVFCKDVNVHEGHTIKSEKYLLF